MLKQILKTIVLTLIVLLTGTTAAYATSVPWDRPAVGRINPLYTQDTVYGNQFVGTSTSATSSFPIASTTNLYVSSLTSGNCVQASTNGLLTTIASACGSGGGSGTVTSVDVSGGTTGLTTSGGPVTGSGTITVAGTLGVANGGTGANSFTAGNRLVVSHGTGAFTDIALPLTVSNGGTGATTLTGLVKGNGTGTMTVGVNGTDYTLITANSCGAGNHLATVTAAGVFTCTADSGGGLATTTPWTVGDIVQVASSGSVKSIATSSLGLISSVTGTPARISVTGGLSPVVNIDSLYAGQNSISTVGTITSGTWNGTPIDVFNGGTGLNGGYSTGDLLVGNFPNLAQLSVGSDGYVLTADSGQANGVKWAPAAGGGGGGSISTSTAATAGYIPVWANASQLTGTSSLFQLAGNIGIGMTTPAAKLEVMGTSTNASDKSLLIWNSTPTALLSVANDGTTAINGNTTITGNSTTTGTSNLSTTTITTTGTTALLVGVNGTTNPALQVDTSIGANGTGLRVKSFASGSGTGISLDALSNNTNDNLTINAKGTGSVFMGSNSLAANVTVAVTASTYKNAQHLFTANTSATAANVRFSMTGAADTSLTAGTESPSVYFNIGQTRQHLASTTIALQRDFRITPTTHSFVSSGGTITQAAALAIDGPTSGGTNATITNSSGLLIGTTSATTLANTTNAYGLQIFAPTGATNNYAASTTGKWIMNGLTNSNTGNYLCWNTATGEVEVNTAACSLSDGRLKTDVQPYTLGLDAVKRLQGVTYNFLPAAGQNVGGRQEGFIAQEVQKIDPLLVSTNKDGTLSLDYPKFVIMLVNAIKDIAHRQDDQQQEIDTLKSQLATQQAQIDALTHKK